MNAYGRAMLVLLVLSMCALAGCKGDKPEPKSPGKPAAAAFKPKPADTPRQALENMVGALNANDRKHFLACFAGTAEEMKAPEVMFEMSATSKAFRDDFVKAYGQEGWEKFQTESPGRANAKLILPEEGFKELDKFEYTVKDDTATVKEPGKRQELHLVKQDGQWRVKASSFVPPGAQADKFCEMMGNLSATVSKYRKAIGAKDIKPEDIDYELGRAIAKQMFGMEPKEPHRFDIDKL